MSHGRRLTVDELEKLTTHEIADMLANIALLLHHLPDVPLNELPSDERLAVEDDLRKE